MVFALGFFYSFAAHQTDQMNMVVYQIIRKEARAFSSGVRVHYLHLCCDLRHLLLRHELWVLKGLKAQEGPQKALKAPKAQKPHHEPFLKAAFNKDCQPPSCLVFFTQRPPKFGLETQLDKQRAPPPFRFLTRRVGQSLQDE